MSLEARLSAVLDERAKRLGISREALLRRLLERVHPDSFCESEWSPSSGGPRCERNHGHRGQHRNGAMTWRDEDGD